MEDAVAGHHFTYWMQRHATRAILAVCSVRARLFAKFVMIKITSLSLIQFVSARLECSYQAIQVASCVAVCQDVLIATHRDAFLVMQF